MKRKTRKTFTLTQKRGLVNEVVTLVARGHNVTEARIKVASMHKTTPISLARWSKDITMNLVNNQTQRINGTSKIHVISVGLHIPGTGNVTLDSTLLNHISKLAGYTS